PHGVSHEGNGGPLPRADQAPAQGRGPRGGRAARRLPLRRGGEDEDQGAAPRGVRPAHDRAVAEGRLRAVHLDRDEPALLHEGPSDEGDLVLRAPLPAGAEELQQDEADPDRGVRGGEGVVERAGRERRRLAGPGGGDPRAGLQPGPEEPERRRRRASRPRGVAGGVHGAPRAGAGDAGEAPAGAGRGARVGAGGAGGGGRVTPETLHRLFDVVADAPGGVQRLRELILQLAVRGKLVPQDPGDEPASVLLERIEAEKERLYAAGKIRKPKKLPPVEADEVPFEVPEGWEWVRLGMLGALIRGVSYSKSDAADVPSPDRAPILRAHNINGVLNFENLVYVLKEKIKPEQYVKAGDLL